MRQNRRALDDSGQAAAADAFADRMAKLALFRNSRRIAFYYPSDGEIDPTPLLETAWQQKKLCYLPVLWHLGGNRLRFAPAVPGMELALNRYDIPEPVASPRHCLHAPQLDLIVLPAVAVDRNGNRLGMGGGYYDRSLAYLRHRRLWRKPQLVAAVHEFQIVAELPRDEWDVRVDGVVTESSHHLFPR
jgi:5-formyltetrahydrofolate cyclo-ligase